LQWNQIGPAGTAVLLSSPNLRGLRELGLNRNPIGDEGAKLHAAARHLTDLHRWLYLSDCGRGPAGVEAIARSALLARLEILDIGYNSGIGDEGAALLARPDVLPRLRDLWAAECGFSAGAKRALRKRFGPAAHL
jgi:hypothetical protein